MSLLRSRAFVRLWLSTLASAGAQGMERTVTAWFALQLGASPLAVGMLFAARMLPSLLLGLVAGTVADRIDRRLQLVAVGLGGLALLCGFGGLVWGGAVGVGLLTLFSFVAGCVQVFDTPARQALVLDTVPPESAARALALVALASRFAGALGALAMGALIPLAGVAGGFAATGAVLGIMALLAGGVRAQHAPRRHGAPPPFGDALRDSLRLMVNTPLVRTLVVAGLVCEVFAFSHMTAVPLFAQDVLRAGPAGLGALNAAREVGGAIAVALLALLPERLDRRRLLGAVFPAYGLALVALSGTRDLTLAVVVLLGTGVCAGAFDVLQQTLLQLAVPAEQRGRAVGLWVFSIGSAPVGHLQMGALIAALGVPAALLINGGLTLAAALALLASAPAFRWGKPKAEG